MNEAVEVVPLWLIRAFGVWLYLCGCTAVVGGVLWLESILRRDAADDHVSPGWLRTQVRAEARLEHVLTVNGRELLRHRSEDVVNGVRREVESLR